MAPLRPPPPASSLQRAALDIVHQLVNHVERSFRALGHPARLRIVERLARGPASVAAVSGGLEVSKPAVTKHLKVLEAAGIVTREVDGRTHTLRLAREPLAEAGGWIERQRALWESKFDAIERYLEEEQR
jgi:DNA-binding transcriptional ArsR family regulator